jgi:cytochrome c oxidase subunit 2
MTKLLILLVIVLGVLAIAQLVRVYELTSRLRGKREEDISPADNRFNARLMWLFPFAYFGFFLWLVLRYKDKMLPVAASEHGVATDQLLDFNWLILIVVFILTNVLLFYFAGKYVYSKDRRAFWQPHNNKLELIWTVIPALVLAVIIIYGLRTWNTITAPAAAGTMQVELYAKQFDWTVRYPGEDGVLGATDFRVISGTNPLGIVTERTIAEAIAEIDTEVETMRATLATRILPDQQVKDMEARIERMNRQKMRIINLRQVMELDIQEKGDASVYKAGADDVVTKDFYLPLNREVQLVIRSRDVIHSMYIPHLRAQMNAVPGMTTTFRMTPTVTTDSMRTVPQITEMVAATNAARAIRGEEPYEFNYVLLCNKICGAAHYNMQLPLIVTKGADYDAWYAELVKKPFEAPAAPATPVVAPDAQAALNYN